MICKRGQLARRDAGGFDRRRPMGRRDVLESGEAAIGLADLTVASARPPSVLHVEFRASLTQSDLRPWTAT